MKKVYLINLTFCRETEDAEGSLDLVRVHQEDRTIKGSFDDVLSKLKEDYGETINTIYRDQKDGTSRPIGYSFQVNDKYAVRDDYNEVWAEIYEILPVEVPEINMEIA